MSDNSRYTFWVGVWVGAAVTFLALMLLSAAFLYDHVRQQGVQSERAMFAIYGFGYYKFDPKTGKAEFEYKFQPQEKDHATGRK